MFFLEVFFLNFFFISLALNKGMFAKTVVAQPYVENVPPATTDYHVA